MSKNKITKKIHQYNIKGEFVETFESLDMAADKTGCGSTGISKVCNGKIYKTKGMRFSYIKLDRLPNLDNEAKKTVEYDRGKTVEISKLTLFQDYSLSIMGVTIKKPTHRTNKNRNYNVVAQMKRKERPIVIKGNYIEIDATNSHPFLLVNKIVDSKLPIEQGAIKLVQDGKFYEFFIKEFENRDSVKKAVFVYLYSKVIDTNSKIHILLKKAYPKFADSIVKVAGTAKSFAMLMQKIESSYWIDGISQKAMDANINHVTIHDSIIVAKKDVNRTLNIIKDVFKTAPKLHIKHLNGNEYKHNFTKEVVNLNPYKDRYFRMGMFEINFLYKRNKDGVYKETISVNYEKIGLVEFLKEHNFKQFNNGNGYIKVRRDGIILHMVTKESTYSYIRNYLENLPFTAGKFDNYFFKKLFHRAPDTFMVHGLNNLSIEDGFKQRMILDTDTCSYVAYKNGVVKVDKTGIILIPYIDITENFKGLIFADNVSSFKYYPVDTENSLIEQFLSKLGDTNTVLNLYKVIGYFLTNYRDSSTDRIINIVDTDVLEGARGGTGKSLMFVIIGMIRNTVLIDGKKKYDDPFIHDEVNLSTDVVYYDDVTKYFKLEQLNVLATNDWAVNPKGKARINIPYAISPKLGVTSNYMLNTLEAGTDRRSVIIEISTYWQKAGRLTDEVGNLLLNNWAEAQRMIEHNFLLSCLQYYFINGMPVNMVTNKVEKLLTNELSMEVYDFLNEKIMAELNDGVGSIFINLVKFKSDMRIILHLDENNKVLGKMINTYCKANKLQRRRTSQNGITGYVYSV